VIVEGRTLEHMSCFDEANSVSCDKVD